jgi:hypothetical protein
LVWVTTMSSPTARSGRNDNSTFGAPVARAPAGGTAVIVPERSATT